MRIKSTFRHPFHWIVEPLSEEPSYVERRMFGSLGCYLNGKLVLILCAQREEPWNGIMIATSREHHASLLKERPELISHPVLGKWLYIPEDHDRFETVAQWAVGLIASGDERIGVIPKRKKRKKKSKEK